MEDNKRKRASVFEISSNPTIRHDEANERRFKYIIYMGKNIFTFWLWHKTKLRFSQKHMLEKLEWLIKPLWYLFYNKMKRKLLSDELDKLQFEEKRFVDTKDVRVMFNKWKKDWYG